MLNKNKLVLASVIGTLFIASCSNEMTVESSSNSAGGAKAYAEFMGTPRTRTKKDQYRKL